MRISRMAGDVVQLLHVPRAYAECEHGRACVLQQVGHRSRITTIAEAVSYQEHYLARRFATLLEDRLENNDQLDDLSSFDRLDRRNLRYSLAPREARRAWPCLEI